MELREAFLASKLFGNGGGGGGSADIIVGALRPDAEKIWSTHYDRLIIQDEGVTKPSYSTSEQTLRAASIIETVELDYENYLYNVFVKGIAIPILDPDTAPTTRPVAWWGCYSQEIVSHIIGSGDGNVVLDHSFTSSYYRELMYLVSGQTKFVNNQAKAAYLSSQALTGSGDFLSILCPALRVKGDTTYMNSASFAALIDIRYIYDIELWRVPANAGGVHGFVLSSMQNELLEKVIELMEP